MYHEPFVVASAGLVTSFVPWYGQYIQAPLSSRFVVGQYFGFIRAPKGVFQAYVRPPT